MRTTQRTDGEDPTIRVARIGRTGTIIAAALAALGTVAGAVIAAYQAGKDQGAQASAADAPSATATSDRRRDRRAR